MSLPPTPPAIAPTMVFSAPPPAPPAAPVRPASVATLIAPAPQNAPRSPTPPQPLAASPTVAPGLPVPNEISKKPQLLLDLGPMESLIAVILTVAVVTGLVFGGYYAYRVLSPSNAADHGPSAQTAPSPDVIDMTQKNMAAGPITMPRLPTPPADAEKQSESLMGYWVSRADDGSVAILDLQKDGVAVYTGASSDPKDARGLRGRWALIEHQNDDVVIDILYAATGLELHRISLHIVSPDCFLVTRSAFRGIVDSPDQRFIRGTRPAS